MLKLKQNKKKRKNKNDFFEFFLVFCNGKQTSPAHSKKKKNNGEFSWDDFDPWMKRHVVPHHTQFLTVTPPTGNSVLNQTMKRRPVLERISSGIHGFLSPNSQTRNRLLRSHMAEPPPPPTEHLVKRYKFIWRVLMISNLALGGQLPALFRSFHWN